MSVTYTQVYSRIRCVQYKFQHAGMDNVSMSPCVHCMYM